VTGVRRAAALAGLLVTAAALVAVPAAMPATAAALCPAQPDPATPVKITITRLEPRNIRPTDEVLVVARLLNCGSTTLTDLRVRLRTGNVLSTRTELADADRQPPEANHALGEWLPVEQPLAAGGQADVQYRTTARALGLTRIGVYPAQLLVQGDQGAGLDQVGDVRTYLPFFPDGVSRPTEVSWLLPIADRPHRLYESSDKLLYDEALAASVVGQGRLNRLLYLAQNADTRRVPYALAMDPDLIDTVYQMSQGYTVVGAEGPVEGRGQRDAELWLNQLIGTANGSTTGPHAVIALPYADADLVALAGGGLDKLAPNPQEGVDQLTERLNGHPVRADIAWPAGGLLTDGALDALVAGKATSVVLDGASMSDSRPGDKTESAASPLPSAGRDAVALVADQGLNRVVAGQIPVAGGARLLEQRYLAELAMITAEAPSVQRRVLVAPPHDWNPDPVAALPMMADTVTVPWLSAGTVAGLAATPATEQVDRGALVYPASAPRLSAGQLDRVRRCELVLDQFRAALDNRAEAYLLSPYPHALLRAIAAAWRTAPAAGAAQLRPVFNRLSTLIGERVNIVKPRDGKYSLASQNSALPLTVVNDLPVPIQVSVVITPRGTAGFHAQVVRATVEGNGRRTQLRIPATVTQSGRFTVDAKLLTPDGHSLGKPVALEVQSTAYGVVALGVTGAAFALMLLLLLRRLIRRFRAGPGQLVPAGSPGERDA
jgi:hypothetical protein